MKNIIKTIKEYWNAPKPTDEEIKVATMLNVLFQDQTTEEVIDILVLFDQKVKEKLLQIKQQAETDKFVTDFYLGTNIRKKVSI